jgi:hypothetical protein
MAVAACLPFVSVFALALTLPAHIAEHTMASVAFADLALWLQGVATVAFVVLHNTTFRQKNKLA